MKDNKKSISTYVFLITTVAFVVMKITGIVDWSWIVVFTPLWVPIALTFVTLMMATMFTLMFGFFLTVVGNFYEKSKQYGQQDKPFKRDGEYNSYKDIN